MNTELENIYKWLSSVNGRIILHLVHVCTFFAADLCLKSINALTSIELVKMDKDLALKPTGKIYS